jgi:nucleotide-binding universal stress UspA family protein
VRERGADAIGQSVITRVQIKKILVPTDFSQASLNALRYAVDFAGRFDASLCLVHVVEPASFVNDVGNVPLAQSDRETANKLHHRLVMLARKEVGPLTPVNPLVCIGNPFHEIARVARTVDADLIIIATRGRSGLKRVFLGSTAERVVRHAPCPVLVVREKERDFGRHGRSSA